MCDSLMVSDCHKGMLPHNNWDKLDTKKTKAGRQLQADHRPREKGLALWLLLSTLFSGIVRVLTLLRL